MLTALGTRKARLLASILVVATLTTGCFASAAERGQGAAPSGLAGQIFDLANADRAANGLPALRWDDRLGGLAQEWSERMGATGNFAHRDLDQVIRRLDYRGFTRLGENILVGSCNMSAADMERAWMNSPGHRANIVGNYNLLGVGVVCMNGRIWATQNFGLR